MITFLRKPDEYEKNMDPPITFKNYIILSGEEEKEIEVNGELFNYLKILKLS